MREIQERSIQNYNSSKNKVFKEGDQVMIKCYKPGSKKFWIKLTVKKVLQVLKNNEYKLKEDKTCIR